MDLCKQASVSKLPVACCQVHMGQTGCCLNDRAIQRECSLTSQLAFSNLPVWLIGVQQMLCALGTCAYLDLKPNPHKVLIIETIKIGMGGACISTASLQRETCSISFLGLCQQDSHCCIVLHFWATCWQPPSLRFLICIDSCWLSCFLFPSESHVYKRDLWNKTFAAF